MSPSPTAFLLDLFATISPSVVEMALHDDARPLSSHVPFAESVKVKDEFWMKM